jgi:hypothetical protein
MITKHPNAQYIVKNGKASAVILPIADYEELLEDLNDLAVIARRKDEPLIPLAEMKKRLATRPGKTNKKGSKVSIGIDA